MTTRKLVREKSVLLALADRYTHGLIVRPDDALKMSAQFHSRCDDCGLDVNPGDLISDGYRPGLQVKLWVHAECPTTDLFTALPWLSRWEGGDIISGWFTLSLPQRCVDCQCTLAEGETAALVRRPGPMVYGHKHSDYKCKECVKI